MRYRVNSPQVINETIDGEAIMINLATGAYYSLDAVGGQVWTVLEQGPATVEDVAEALQASFDASHDEIVAGVRSLVEQLAAEELVVTTDEPAAAAAAPAADGPKTSFTPPRLDKFTDMQDLILLDPVHEVDSRGWPHTVPADGTAG
ncbi:MAG TPA: PqqD family protein [Acidimicrobiales bacterium]|nr:PqqD family protein [Acidimicrobiales bacterium]